MIIGFWNKNNYSNKNKYLDYIKEILLWLTEIQGYGEIFKNIIAQQLGKEPITPMKLLIEKHSKLDKSIQIILHDLYFQLIVDYTFKKILLIYIIQYYDHLIETSIKHGMSF